MRLQPKLKNDPIIFYPKLARMSPNMSARACQSAATQICCIYIRARIKATSNRQRSIGVPEITLGIAASFCKDHFLNWDWTIPSYVFCTVPSARKQPWLTSTYKDNALLPLALSARCRPQKDALVSTAIIQTEHPALWVPPYPNDPSLFAPTSDRAACVGSDPSATKTVL